MIKTSITQAQAAQFLKTASAGQRLQCEKISGFHLFKTPKGIAWRWRYLGVKNNGERNYKVKTIGNAEHMTPAKAVVKVVSWIEGDIDPLLDDKKKKHTQVNEQKNYNARIMRTYIEQVYTPFQEEQKRSGNETINRLKANFGDLMDRDMDSLTKLDIREWQISRQKKGSAHTTISRSYSALKTMLNYAVKEHDVLTENPLKDVYLMPQSDKDLEKSRSNKETIEAKRRLLTDKELTSITQGLKKLGEKRVEQRNRSRAHGKAHLPDLSKLAFPHWFIPFCELAMFTGMRSGDLYSLKWNNIDLSFQKQITFEPNKTRHHPDPVKVVMPLTNHILALLIQWHQQNGKPSSGYVFSNDGAMFTKHAHDKPWNEAKKLGHLKTPLDFYAFRHHFISKLISDNVPLFAVAKLAGHKSVAMIEKHYGHLCRNEAVEYMKRFGESMDVRV